jgi:hypothetical protein
MSVLLKDTAQLWRVVDFAVESHDKVAVCGNHRLCATRQIDNLQSAVAEMDGVILPEALAVRAAMGETARHAL